MELYTKTSYEISRTLTLRYSTSFGKSTKLFPKTMQPHIFAIYGLVRVADEIVDTYTGDHQEALLDELEQDAYRALKVQYSANPLVHAFAVTAKQFNIDDSLIQPFFRSMRLDLAPRTYTQKLYEEYIYGSAEVIGLMCLKVFVHGDESAYARLSPGASALGAAYQKVNFLCDIASDYYDRGRMYFPEIKFETFDEAQKRAVVADIEADFLAAESSIRDLPKSSRAAVGLSHAYYLELLKKLKATPIETIKKSRIRVPAGKKAALGLRHSLNIQKGTRIW